MSIESNKFVNQLDLTPKEIDMNGKAIEAAKSIKKQQYKDWE